jgi:hypothetical protein
MSVANNDRATMEEDALKRKIIVGIPILAFT